MGIECRAGPIGDGIAECDDGGCRARGTHIDGFQPIHGGGLAGKALAVGGFGLIAGAIVGDIGSDLRIVVLARLHIRAANEEAHRQILLRIHMQGDGIAFRCSPGRDGDGVFSGEHQWTDQSDRKRGPAHPRTNARMGKYHGRRAETVVQADSD